jgi:hypothetical protein
MANEEKKPIVLAQAEQLRDALQQENPNWNISIGLAESFNPKEADQSKRPRQIDVWFNSRTGNSFDLIGDAKNKIQAKARALFEHSLCDDAISVRPKQVSLKMGSEQEFGRN